MAEPPLTPSHVSFRRPSTSPTFLDRPRAQSEGPVAGSPRPAAWTRQAPQSAPAPPAFVPNLAATSRSGDVRTEADTGNITVDASPQASAPNPIPTSAPSPPMRTSPIASKDWILADLMKDSNNFQEVRRVSCLDDAWTSTAEECERQGIPLIVEGWHTHRSWLEAFSADFLVARHPGEVVSVRNVGNFKDADMTLSDFVEYSRMAPPHSNRDALLYAKDVECPKEWREWFRSGALPSELQPHGCTDFMRHPPESERVETIMCYYGIGDTFTPCHKDLCGSTGHNLMCHAENGSSFWFMTASNAASEVAKYFQENIGGELDWENRATTVEELRNAPFTVYVAEQKLGDLIIIPPRSCHQVVNHGGLTMKLSWSRMTIAGLMAGLLSELPVYRRVCRPEIYRVKSILYHSLRYYSNELEEALHNPKEVGKKKVKEIAVLEMLVPLFEHVLREEFGESEHIEFDADCGRHSSVNETDAPSLIPSGSASSGAQYTCDYCGADIFQSYFRCETCCAMPATDGRVDDALVICAACYVEGRSCKCGNMTPTQRHRTEALLDDRNKAALILHHLHTSSCLQGHALSLTDLRKSDDVCVFRAACVLHARRAATTKQSKRDFHEWTCRWDKEATHMVPHWSAVYCSSCHSSTCMMHLLEMGVHASQAFLALEKTSWRTDPSPHWHHFHQHARIEAKRIEETLQNGEGVRLSAQLVCAAQDFRNSRTLNPKFTVGGFYDREAALIEPTEEDIRTDMDSAGLASHPQTPGCSATSHSPSPACESPASSLTALSDSDPGPAEESNIAAGSSGGSTSMTSPRFDTPEVVRLDAPPPPPLPRRNLAYVLAPAPSQKRIVPEATDQPPPKKRKVMAAERRSGPPGVHGSGSRDSARVVRQPRQQRARELASHLETDDETLGDDYAPNLANVFEQAYRPPRKEGPPKHSRGINSPASHHDPPPPQATHEAERIPQKRIVTLPLPAVGPRRALDTETTFPRAAQPTPIRSDRPLSAVASTSHHHAPTSIVEPRPAKASASIRAPPGKPPGKPANIGHEEIQEQMSCIRQSKMAPKVARDTSCFVSSSEARRRVSDLEERVRQLERDQTAANHRLADTETKLASARAECETLQKENDMFQDYRRIGEHQKARVGELEEGIKTLTQSLDRASGKLELQDQTIKEKEMRLSEQREELVKQQAELEKRQEECSDLHGVLQWMAATFENYLRHGNSHQPPANYQQDMMPAAPYEQIRQDVGEILRRLPTSPRTGGVPGGSVGFPHGDNTQSFASGPAPSIGTTIITSHCSYYGPGVNQASQSQEPTRPPAPPPPRRNAPWQRNPQGYPNPLRPGVQDRDPYPPPRQTKPRPPTGRSADVERWAMGREGRPRPDWGVGRPNWNVKRPNWNVGKPNWNVGRPNWDVGRREPLREPQSRNSADRSGRVDRDDTLGPRTPPRTSRPESPPRAPSSVCHGYEGSRYGESERGSPVSRRAPSVSTSEHWEDNYGRDDEDDRELPGSGYRTPVSPDRSRSSTGSGVSEPDRYAHREPASLARNIAEGSNR